jgi:RNA polymerase sigma-70 factor, ECF subfamily
MRAIEVHELESHRTALLRFAVAQLRDQTHAEDCVQEALSAAIENASRFAGQSSVRTWLIGILKHKILDHFRTLSRNQTVALTERESTFDDFDALFEEDGHFIEAPAFWANPEQALSQAQFFAVLEACMDRLPKNTALVFRMREIMGVDVEEICKELSITSNNCWVLIYRARMSLRECLEKRWFTAKSES